MNAPTGSSGGTGSADGAGSWGGLVTTATLGTDRRPLDLAEWDGLPGDLARAVGSGGPARLLDAAALAAAYRRAGSSPLVAGARPAPEAPAPVRPEVPTDAARRLRELLDAGERRLLTEWLGLAASHRYRAPSDCLPRLLDLAAGPSDLGGLVAAVLDLPGAWLAGFRPDWTRAVAAAAPVDGPPPDAWWTHGTSEQRVGWLLAARATDPVAGREALEQVWPREKADDRVALVAALGPQLSGADEDLLERALDDRSAQVRAAAARLLAGLPGSALVHRWTGRLAAQVAVERTALRGRRVVVRVPARSRETALDDALRRDLAGHRVGTGLLGLLSAAPAHSWSAVLGEPASFVPLEVAGADRVELHETWALAARRDGDVGLARALLDAGSISSGLLALVPATERSARAVGLLRSAGGGPASLEVLAACPAPWDAHLVDAVVGLLGPAGHDAASAVRGRHLLELLAQRADARDGSARARLRQVVELLPPTSSLHPAAVRAWETLSVRVRLHAELAGSTSATDPDPPGDGTTPGGDR